MVGEIFAIEADLVSLRGSGEAFSQSGLNLVDETGFPVLVGLRKLIEEVGQVGVGKLQTQIARGRGGEVVGFVDHKVGVFAEGGVFHLQIGQQQGVVGHHDGRGLDVFAQVQNVALGREGAFASQAEIAVRTDLAPDNAEAVAVEGGIFAHIAGFGEHFPDEEVEQGLRFPNGQSLGLFGEEFTPTPFTDIVLAPLHQRGLEGQGQHVLQLRQILVKELFLEVFGVGGDHDLGFMAIGKGKGRNQIGKGFAHSGAGFHGQVFTGAEGRIDLFRHLHLAAAEFEIGEFPRKQAVLREDLRDIEAGFRDIVFHDIGTGGLRRLGLFSHQGSAALLFHDHAQIAVKRVFQLCLAAEVEQSGVGEHGIVGEDVFAHFHQQQPGRLSVGSCPVGVFQNDAEVIRHGSQPVVRGEGKPGPGDLHRVPDWALDQISAAEG